MAPVEMPTSLALFRAGFPYLLESKFRLTLAIINFVRTHLGHQGEVLAETPDISKRLTHLYNVTFELSFLSSLWICQGVKPCSSQDLIIFLVLLFMIII
jgi:hypothetical protein